MVTDDNKYAIGGGRSKGWWDTNTIQVIKEKDGHYRQELVKKNKSATNTLPMSQGDYTNQFLEDMKNKPVAEWDDKLKPAYDKGKRGIPSGKLSICKNTIELQQNILNQLSSNMFSINHPTINQIVQILGNTNKNLEDRWVKIANVCKKDLDSYFRLHSDKKLDVIFRAIAEFDANLRSWPSIKTLEQLLIAQQKREACQALYKDVTRLVYKLNEATDSKAAAALQMKIDAYQSLINAILRSDKDERLSVMLREDSTVMKSNVTGKDIQLYPLANPSIQGALYHNRGYGLSQASSKDLLDKLRDELVDMDTTTILHVNKPVHHSDSKNTLLEALIGLRTNYTNKNRTAHLDDINKLISEVEFIIDKYKGKPATMNNAIEEKIRSAYEKEKRYYKKPTLGFFGTGKTEDDFLAMIKNKSSEHQYLKLLHKLVVKNNLLVQDTQPSIDVKNLQ